MQFIDPAHLFLGEGRWVNRLKSVTKVELGEFLGDGFLTPLLPLGESALK